MESGRHSQKGFGKFFRPRLLVLQPLMLLLAALAAGCGQQSASYPLGDRISNSGEVIASIREGLHSHAGTITVSFDYSSDIYGELNEAVGEWVEAALGETDAPAEGDYIRYQYGGYTYESSYSAGGGQWHYTVEIVPDYYTYLTQEEAVTAAVEDLLGQFAFDSDASEYEKLRVIYDWLCRNVSYDKVHRKNPYSHLKSTAYAALVRRSATCQGYCTALYRLLRESGVDCRIVTGSAGGEFHAWVIASVDGIYYNLDPTWDAGQEEYRYFLQGSAGFGGHLPDERFLHSGFTALYPVSEESFRKEGSK